MTDRPFDPSPERKQTARREGRFPRSVDVSGLVVCLSATYLILVCGTDVMVRFEELVLEQAQQLTLNPQASTDVIATRVPRLALGFLFPFAGLIALLAVISQIMQGGWVWIPNRAVPNVNRLRPRGAGSRLATCVALLFKAAVVLGAVAWLVPLRLRSIASSDVAPVRPSDHC